MANGSKNLSGTLIRELQLGIDKRINHFQMAYISPMKELYNSIKTDKGFFEIVQEAGMTPAARRNEGQVITAFDTINQDFDAHYTIYAYQKSARASREAIADNLYMDLPSQMAKCIAVSHEINRDIQMTSLLNQSTTTNWADGSPILSTAHSLQAGGTNTNRLSPDLDLSLDAVQQAIILVHQFKNPDGNLGDYHTEQLIVPTALQFIADTILNSRFKTGSANNDINPVNRRGDLQDYMVVRRLTSATTWYISTNQKENGLIIAERQGIETNVFKDNFTGDTVVESNNRFRCMLGDHRRFAGSVGP